MLLLIDNYDSFTFNLVHYIGELGTECLVKRNDALDVQAAMALKPSGILLSPGPCDPDRAGICLALTEAAAETGIPVFHHVGCYAFRADALERYGTLSQGRLERAEGLEQLRFLENGIPVRCVEVDARGRAFWELNNPSDIPLIEDIMKREGIA